MVRDRRLMVRDRFHSVGYCSECGSDEIIEDYGLGELVCKECGLVLREYALDRRPEWRAFTKEERTQRTRVGAPISYATYDKGLSTRITRINQDASGRSLPLSTRLHMLRLQRWHRRTSTGSSVERNLIRAMAELDRLTDKLHIPKSIKEEAALIYRRALRKRLVRGRSIAAIAAAALYAACRFTATPRTLREISSATRVRKKDVARCYRLLLRKLDMKMSAQDPIRYLSKIVEGIGVSPKTERRAIKILTKAKEKGIITGKHPLGVAAAAMYIAGMLEGETVTQKEIADTANMTEMTVRNRCKGLKQALDLKI